MMEQIGILYRDDALAVCIKPVGLDSQNGMCRALEAQLGCPAFCVHRLDQGVGGVMVYALTAKAAAACSRSIASGEMQKTYLAVCEGVPAPAQGEMRDLLYHDTAKNKSYVVQRRRRGVRDAALTYRVLESREGCSLVSVTLLTGRSHQIRVQFASRAVPLCGDGRYGAKSRGAIALWSNSIAFPHPESGQPLRFSAPPPQGAPWDLFEWKTAAE